MTATTHTTLLVAVLISGLVAAAWADDSRTGQLQPGSLPYADFIVLGRTEGSAAAAATCTPKWQGPNAGWLTTWHVGKESYAAYQDPSEVGCANPFPFKVQNMYWRLTNQTSTQLTVRIQPLIYSLSGTQSCPKPGDTLYQGPIYTLNLPALSTGLAMMETPGAPCLTGPYFMVAYCPDSLGSGKLGINLDSAQVVPLRTCAAYTNYRGPWEDVVTVFHFPGNLTLWSDGITADSNSCNTGGACCAGLAGNVDCDSNDNIDVGDLTTLISHLFVNFEELCCLNEANADGLAGIDVGDLTRLIDYLFISFAPPTPCP